MNPNPLSMRSRAIVPVGIAEALRSEPPSTITRGLSRVTGASDNQIRAVGRRTSRVASSVTLSWKIGASLGSSKPEVKGCQLFAGRMSAGYLPCFGLVLVVFVILFVVFVVFVVLVVLVLIVWIVIVVVDVIVEPNH